MNRAFITEFKKIFGSKVLAPNEREKHGTSAPSRPRWDRR